MTSTMTTATSVTSFGQELVRLFGPGAFSVPLSSDDRMGRRIHGVDLTVALSEEQAQLLVALLDRFSVISFPDQGHPSFKLRYLERLANHFGAPITHPKNYANYIEFEPIPLSTSLFYVQRAPTTRDSAGGTWVADIPPDTGFYHPDSPQELTRRRLALPLNGETAYADTAAAFADLPQAKQVELEQTMVRRRLRAGDPGWLIPLVYTNPRTGTRSLHSPVWASRGKNIAPVEVDGMSVRESREFLDEIENHVLHPRYRYDHVHTPGDIAIWSNFSTLHNAPPAKRTINNPQDARLMYRISCKGEPSYNLPRRDTDSWIEANILAPYRSLERWFEDAG